MDVLMPQLGETVAEGKITKWFKAAGDAVKPGDNLFEIETDKVSMEVPATEAGVLSEIRVPEGEVALVGAVVGEFLGSRHGIGLLISTEQGLFSPAGVFAAMIVLAVVALAADYLLTWAENRLLKWRPPSFADIRN